MTQIGISATRTMATGTRKEKLFQLLDEDQDGLFEEEEESLSHNHELGVSESIVVDPSICVECQDHPSELFCQECQDFFCQLCCEGQHRKGNRRSHTHQPVDDNIASSVGQDDILLKPTLGMTTITVSGGNKSTDEEHDDEDEDLEQRNPRARNFCSAMGSLLLPRSKSSTSPSPSCEELHDDPNHPLMKNHRARYIPLRLTYEERKELRTLEAALAVSSYTDKIDTTFKRPGQRARLQMRELCGFLTGLVVACDYELGQELLEHKDFGPHADFFQRILELGRRYKIMNPEKMRGEYGKLMYLLQDAVHPDTEELLEFSCLRPIETVFSFLESRGGLGLLLDADVDVATQVVAPEAHKSRAEIQKHIRKKELAIKRLSKTYQSASLSRDDIQRCLYSMGDHNYHLYFERDPIDAMIRYLEEKFDPETRDSNSKFSLAIESGQDGARLSHSHARQYHYVRQSLTLWREIAHDMFRLWYLTDEDLLDQSHAYTLQDTGQGMHRIQNPSRVSRAMNVILHMTQRKNHEHWVGSSVIHLGDKNVPNALQFIDKYAQVGHILRPIVKTVLDCERIARIYPGLREHFIEPVYGSVEDLRKSILADFFREAFDGSGADNFFDAGSCIDGRLTSAWNWCSRLPEKPFYPIFKLAGFVGFDGKFG